jgi:hypothetical protein
MSDVVLRFVSVKTFSDVSHFLLRIMTLKFRILLLKSRILLLLLSMAMPEKLRLKKAVHVQCMFENS